MDLVLLCQSVMTQGLNENLDIPGGCEALIEFCDVVFRTRPEIAGALSHALELMFRMFESMKLRFVKPRTVDYNIIVNNSGNEIVLRIPKHTAVRFPSVTIDLNDVCKETRGLIYNVNNMVKRTFERSVIHKDGTFKLYLSKHTVLRFRRRRVHVLVRVSSFGITTIKAWNMYTFANENYIGYHIKHYDN